MSQRATAFVEEWVLENVITVPTHESLAAAVAASAPQMPETWGISVNELRDAFESLTAFMKAAIVTVLDLSRDRSKDN